MQDGSVGSTPGWYPDPGGEHDLRYHNGRAWTGDVATDGERHVAPLRTAGQGVEHDDRRRRNDVEPRDDRRGSAPLVLGIVALCIAWIPFISVIGGGLAVAAIVLGLRRRSSPPARPAANIGIVTGAVAVLLAVFGTWLGLLVLREVERFDDPGPHAVTGVTCQEVDGVTRATGTIENRSDSTRSYTIEVTFERDHTVSTDVDDVAAGSAAPFVVDEDLRFDDLTCEVTAVHGPLPFGLDVGL